MCIRIRQLTAVAAAAWILASAGAWAQSKIVPIEQEPMHQLKFQNRHVRLFDVLLPPGYFGVWHSHIYDGVFVNIEPRARAQDLGAEPADRAPRIIGETYFNNYTKKPKVHRVANSGGLPRRRHRDPPQLRRLRAGERWRGPDADPRERSRARYADHDRPRRKDRPASAVRHAGRGDRGQAGVSLAGAVKKTF